MDKRDVRYLGNLAEVYLISYFIAIPIALVLVFFINTDIESGMYFYCQEYWHNSTFTEAVCGNYEDFSIIKKVQWWVISKLYTNPFIGT